MVEAPSLGMEFNRVLLDFQFQSKMPFLDFNLRPIRIIS
uniref:Uncharacterized protein n=1 Tax=Cucumis melo TaxID=3656 RepID=A0A9I9EHW6_CUCME